MGTTKERKITVDDDNVEKFLQEELSWQTRISQGVKSDIIRKIKQQADSYPSIVKWFPYNRFVLVKLQLRYAMAKYSLIDSELFMLPRNVGKGYDEVIERIVQGDHKDTAFKILSWLHLSRTALGMDELRHVLSVAEDSVDLPRNFLPEAHVGKSCEDLVERNPEANIVRFKYPSVDDFLSKDLNERYKKFLFQCQLLRWYTLVVYGQQHHVT